VKDQVLESPFLKKEFLELVGKTGDLEEVKHDTFTILNSTYTNIGSRDFVDYRPTVTIHKEFIKENNISNINFDSLHFFQIQELVHNLEFKSLNVKKTDISVNLILPNSYEEYLQNLTKKNRHELKRKKRKFSDEINNYDLKDSNAQDIFDIFVAQHRTSKGLKGEFMTKEVETYFNELLNITGWKIYYLEANQEVLSTAFCYENSSGCYLYNSSRNNEFNSINPGIVLNDLIIQELIDKEMSFFDFLKGTERYKFDLGGKSVQLYDLEASL